MLQAPDGHPHLDPACSPPEASALNPIPKTLRDSTSVQAKAASTWGERVRLHRTGWMQSEACQPGCGGALCCRTEGSYQHVVLHLRLTLKSMEDMTSAPNDSSGSPCRQGGLEAATPQASRP